MRNNYSLLSSYPHCQDVRKDESLEAHSVWGSGLEIGINAQSNAELAAKSQTKKVRGFGFLGHLALAVT